ncbi:MAG: PaaI family thioesterase [Pseudomonadota bacterium]
MTEIDATGTETLDGVELKAGFGTSPVEVLRTMSGLDYMRGICEGRFPAATIARALGFRMAQVEEGKVMFTGVPTEAHMNPIGTVHGGWAATILDSALACSVHTLAPIGYASTSVELKVNFVRPILPTTGRLYCHGSVIHPGRQLATSEARLTDENGKLFAHGTQTCSIFKL